MVNTYRIHLEVDQFSSSEGDHDLTLVDSALHDGLFAWCLPFVDTLIRSNVTYTVRIYLKDV
jgi:hypothetical protein